MTTAGVTCVVSISRASGFAIPPPATTSRAAAQYELRRVRPQASRGCKFFQPSLPPDTVPQPKHTTLARLILVPRSKMEKQPSRSLTIPQEPYISILRAPIGKHGAPSPEEGDKPSACSKAVREARAYIGEHKKDKPDADTRNLHFLWPDAAAQRQRSTRRFVVFLDRPANDHILCHPFHYGHWGRMHSPLRAAAVRRHFDNDRRIATSPARLRYNSAAH